jgi:hypothetical protein
VPFAAMTSALFVLLITPGGRSMACHEGCGHLIPCCGGGGLRVGGASAAARPALSL